MFHLSLLKKKVGNQCEVAPYLPTSFNQEQLLGEPIAVLDRQTLKRNNAVHVKVLIQWSNALPEDTPREDWDTIYERYPHFNP